MDLGEISGLSLSTSADVFLKQGSTREIKVSGQENILDNLELTNEFSVFTITNKVGVRKSEPVKIYVTLPMIDLIRIAGSGDVQMVNHFSNLKDLTVRITGSGDIVADLDGEKVVAVVTGSGNISLTGKAGALDLTIRGSGDISAREFRVHDANVLVKGSGDVAVHVDGTLKGQVSGSGNIGYLGEPSVSFHESGSGEIYKIRN